MGLKQGSSTRLFAKLFYPAHKVSYVYHQNFQH